MQGLSRCRSRNFKMVPFHRVSGCFVNIRAPVLPPTAQRGNLADPDIESLLNVPCSWHVTRKGDLFLPSANAIRVPSTYPPQTSNRSASFYAPTQHGIPYQFERVPGSEGTKSTRMSVLPHRESTMSS